jgi:putative Mg2+ transporter-C (MgtC) family protein
VTAALTWSDIAVRLALTIVAGFLIGLDRGAHAQRAGLRTTILVAVAAAVAMILANRLAANTTDTHVSVLRLDMMRLPLGVLSGIGFIGAGAILRRDDLVRGVTTAATIWLTTIIGLCLGGGQLGLGAAATLIALATLWLLKLVEGVVVTSRRGTIAITYAAADLPEGAVLSLLAQRGFRLSSREVARTPEGAVRLTCNGRYAGAYPEWSSALVRDLAATPGVSRVAWRDVD